MSNVKFTRDEIILALDVLYTSGMNRASKNSKEMYSLSELLNRIPIHQKECKKNGFRTPSGIAQQVNYFVKSCELGEKSQEVGKRFFEVALEYEGREQELHQIAEAIKRNEKNFNLPFGNILEDDGFPEGILLGHLHRIIEKENSQKIEIGDKCEICGMNPNLAYKTHHTILQLHLLVPPIQMEANRKYDEDKYITVCPMCHTVLHRIRPWCTRDNCTSILR